MGLAGNPETIDDARRRLRPYVERARGFTGWNSPVQFRPIGASHPWDYLKRASTLIAASASAVDIGTGGGERFGEICGGFEGFAVATEEWHVNLPVAAARLQPLGIEVVRCRDSLLCFADESFDLVLNRHSELDPSDVARCLRSGGTVLTQQVFHHWHELGRFIPRRVTDNNLFERYCDGFRDSGLEIVDARVSEVPAAYDSLGDFVYMLCIAPWEIPDFDPLGSDLDALIRLEREVTTQDGLMLTDGSFILEARRP